MPLNDSSVSSSARQLAAVARDRLAGDASAAASAGCCSRADTRSSSPRAPARSARASSDGYFSSHSAYFGSTRSTCVCCSMISDTRMWYGSSVLRHGRSRPWRRYHVSSRWRNRRRSARRRQSAAWRAVFGCRLRASRIIASTVKIYTRTGDAGETSLFGGTRVSEDDPRVDAYGEVDELNAWLGLARAPSPLDPRARRRARRSIQRDLFALGAQLADPARQDRRRASRRRRSATTTWRGSSADRPARGRAAAAARVSSWPAARRPAPRCTSRARSAAAPSAAWSRSIRRSIRCCCGTSTGCPICCSCSRASANHRAGVPEIEW